MITIFEAPQLLILAVVLPVFIALLLGTAQRRRAARLARMGSGELISRLLPAGTMRPTAGRIATLSFAALFAAIAVAGPRWGTSETKVSGSGIDIVLALDASLSMLANDDRPTRLERMKQEVRRLRASSHGDRIGVIAFAGRSYILTPLTTDEGALDLFLDNLDPAIVGLAGSAVSRAIIQGTDLLLASQSASDRALVIMSDWESFEEPEAVAAAARKARDAGINVVTVGFGTAAGSRIPLEQMGATGSRTSFKTDEAGRIVTTRYNADLLRSTAEIAGGAYVEASETDKAARIRRALSNLREQRRSVSLGVDHSPRFQLFLIPALLLVILDTYRADKRRTAPPALGTRERRLVAAAVRRGAAAVSLAVIMISPPQRGRGTDAEDRGRTLLRDNNYVQAIQEYRRMIREGDNSERTLYNLGTALLLADSLESAGDALDRVAKSDSPETRYRALFNRGLAQLIAGRRTEGSQRGAALDDALAAYKDALLMRPDDPDAKWNYELALREKEHGSGGGGGQQDQQQHSSQDNRHDENQQQEAPSGLGREQAEQILNNAARDERDVQARSQDRNRPTRPPGGKDW